jgi:multidrug transporter EmrE-like cation transporter
MQYFLLVLNVIFMTCGQLFFKKSADFLSSHPNLHFPMNYIANPWFYVAISFFAIATFVWTQILTKMPLSIAYPIASFAYIFTLLGAFLFFHEKISQQGVVGVVFIMAGITLTVLK